MSSYNIFSWRLLKGLSSHFNSKPLTIHHPYSKNEFAWRNNATCLKILGSTTHCVRHGWKSSPTCGWISIGPCVSFKFWLNLTFIGNISNTLAGTSFKQCEPEVNNSPMKRAVCLTVTFLCGRARFQHNPEPVDDSVCDCLSSSFIVHVETIINLLIQHCCVTLFAFYLWYAKDFLLEGIFTDYRHKTFTSVQSGDWQGTGRLRVRHMARWAAFNVLNSMILTSLSHWSTIISKHFVVGARETGAI